MRILVDLDGPCYKFAETVVYMLNHYRERGLPSVYTFWNEWYPKEIRKSDWNWVFTKGIGLGVFRYGHMTKGARVGLQALNEAGHELVIATKRPPAAIGDTVDWVGLFFKDIPLQGLHILGDEQSKSTIEGEVLIDDNWQNCQEWVEDGPLDQMNRAALLFDSPWNQQTGYTDDYRAENHGIYRVKGWEEVVRWVNQRETAITETSKRSSSESFRPYFPPPPETGKRSASPTVSPHGGGTRRTRLLSGPILRDTREGN